MLGAKVCTNVVKGDDPAPPDERSVRLVIRLHAVVGVVTINEQKIERLDMQLSLHLPQRVSVVRVRF